MRSLYTKISILFILIFLLLSAQAKCAPAIYDIDISVELDDAGTAHITEVWKVNVTSGTEWYLVQGNLGKITISNFSVSDETGKKYITESNWDIDRSISQKAGRCGIVRKSSNSYELCWGVGSYGEHTFTASYTMSNFVKAFNDYNGFNHQFITNNLSSAPEHARVTIWKKGTTFTSDDTRVWAFGFEGEIYVEDGKVVAASTEKLRKNSTVTIMVRFDKSMFSPTNEVNQDFSEMQNRALEGSDYNGNKKTSFWERFFTFIISAIFFIISAIFFIIFALLFLLLPLSCIFNLQWNKQRKVFGVFSKQSIDWSREIPFGGNLYAANYILKRSKNLKSENAIISALLLRWMQNGLIEIKSVDENKNLFQKIFSLGNTSVLFSKTDKPTDKLERSLFNNLKTAAGEDKILQTGEFRTWARKHYSIVYSWLRKVEKQGEEYLVENGILEEKEERHTTIYIFGKLGKKEACKVIGFKKYLKDFSIINERKATEVNLWNDYLVYASLFGIADEVSKDFKDIYPKYFEQGSTNNMLFVSTAMSSSFMSGAKSGYSAAHRSSGGGGHSSFGGGGGSSGGGGGGGSR